MSRSGSESCRFRGGGLVEGMLMSLVVSERGSRSATDFGLIIGKRVQ